MLSLKKLTQTLSATPVRAPIYDLRAARKKKRYTSYLAAFEQYIDNSNITRGQKALAFSLYEILIKEDTYSKIIPIAYLAKTIRCSISTVKRALDALQNTLKIIHLTQVPTTNGFIYKFTLVTPPELQEAIEASPDNNYCKNSNKSVKMSSLYINNSSPLKGERRIINFKKKEHDPSLLGCGAPARVVPEQEEELLRGEAPTTTVVNLHDRGLTQQELASETFKVVSNGGGPEIKKQLVEQIEELKRLQHIGQGNPLASAAYKLQLTMKIVPLNAEVMLLEKVANYLNIPL